MNGTYPSMMGPGMVPNPYYYQQQVQTKNWLPDDDVAKLQKRTPQFSLSVTQDEVLRAQCNHYNPLIKGGNSTLILDPDGSGRCTCSVCGETFNCRDFTQEEVKAAVDAVLDIANNIKIMYISMEPAVALQFFQFIPFLKKLPELYSIAAADFKKYEGIDSFIPGNQNINPFNIYAMMTTPGYGMMPPTMGYYQQPQQFNPGMNAGFAQPAYQPQPQAQAPAAPPFNPGMNAGFAQPNPAFNPVTGQPTGYYQPQMTGFSMNPTGAAAPVNTNMPNASNPTGAPMPAPTSTAPGVAAEKK